IGWGFDWETAAKILVQPLLRTHDGFVRMSDFQRNDSESRLPCARSLNQHGLSTLHRNLVAAKFFDKIEAEIESSVHAPAAIESAVLRHHQFGHPLHVRIFLAKPLSQCPVCSGALAIEETSCCDQAHACAHAGDFRAPFMPSS